jgi:hypothetical protein
MMAASMDIIRVGRATNLLVSNTHWPHESSRLRIRCQEAHTYDNHATHFIGFVSLRTTS